MGGLWNIPVLRSPSSQPSPKTGGKLRLSSSNRCRLKLRRAAAWLPLLGGGGDEGERDRASKNPYMQLEPAHRSVAVAYFCLWYVLSSQPKSHLT